MTTKLYVTLLTGRKDNSLKAIVHCNAFLARGEAEAIGLAVNSWRTEFGNSVQIELESVQAICPGEDIIIRKNGDVEVLK